MSAENAHAAHESAAGKRSRIVFRKFNECVPEPPGETRWGGTDRNEIWEGFFWAKIAAFVAVALLSIVPTIQIIRWRRALTADAAVLPAAPDIAGVRRFMWAEVVFFAFIPAFAAAMARGYGAFAR